MSQPALPATDRSAGSPSRRQLRLISLAWALLAGVIQIVVFVTISRLAFRNLVARIEAGEIAAAVYLASISICVGLLNAACMTS